MSVYDEKNIELEGKVYSYNYIKKALLFFEHLENHIEVKKAPISTGIPMCKICGKNAEQIFKEAEEK